MSSAERCGRGWERCIALAGVDRPAGQRLHGERQALDAGFAEGKYRGGEDGDDEAGRGVDERLPTPELAGRLAARPDLAVLLRAAPEAVLGDLVALLDALTAAGVRNVSLLEADAPRP